MTADHNRLRRISSACLASLCAVFLGCTPALAQAGQGYVAPRNAIGQPDLGGLWTNATSTGLERAKEFGDRLVMTAEEASRFQRSRPATPGAPADAAANSGGRVLMLNGEYRTSFLVEPKDGRLPALTPEALAARTARKAAMPRGANYSRGADPESMTLAERCLKDFGSSSGPPMLPVGYNNTYQIVQTPDHVMILIEMIHDVRVIPLKRDGHRPAVVKQWMGDSVGWYDGDALVVETTNFRPGQAFLGVAETMKLTERFRRVGEGQILYSFEIDEPKLLTAPVKAELALNATTGPLYEYACHEGNYSFASMLGGQREADRQMSALRAAAEQARR
jgi:hypothetical protein